MADRRGRKRVKSDESLRAIRKIQTDLEASEQRFKAITESAPVAIGVVSRPKGTILFTNHVFERLFGYAAAELTGRKAPDLYVDPSDRKRLLEVLKERGAVEDFEVRLKRKDGTTLWGLASASPVSYEGHDANLHSFIDITERKRAEDSLAETRDYLEKLFNYANAPIIVWDPDSRITRFNGAFEELAGYRAEEVIGRKLELLFPKDSKERSLGEIERTAKGGHWETIEIPILRKDGTTRMALWNSANIYDKDGRTIISTIAQGQDITERKRAEDSLAEARDYLEKLINYANAPIIVWGPDSRITRFNGAFEKLAGYRAEEVIGRKLELLFPKDSKERSLEEIERTAKGGHWEIIEIPILRKDGTTRIALWNSANIYDKDGRTIISTIAQGQDITDRKKAEQALQKARERNSQQEKLAAIGRLAGGVAHELRNPLAAMKNAAYYLNMTVDRSDPLVAETLAVIDREIKRSDDVISSLLGLARPAQPSRFDVDVSALLKAVLEHQPRPPNVSLEARLAEALPPVTADPAQLSIAFGNIVRNGYESMPGEGTLTVSSSVEGGWVVAEVADSGTGMSPEVLGRLFEPLFTTKPGGTGLGLSVAKMLVEGSGGSIDVRSELGKGSVFCVRLPAKRREGR